MSAESWFSGLDKNINLYINKLFSRMRDSIVSKYGFSKMPPGDSSESNICCSHEPTDHPIYISWLEKHPCALSVFKKMIEDEGKGKQIVVFLDYDGTLSPIVDDPNLAFMSNEMRSAVGDVAKYFPTAIISGRSRKKVYEFVKLDKVYYAGSHGMDIKGPPLPSYSNINNILEVDIDNNGNEMSLYQPARDFLPALQKIMEELKTRTCDIIGVFIEDNQFCLSVHYRHVQEDDYDELEKIVFSIVEEFGSFKVTKGKKVLEIRPSIEWNKGNALVYLLQTLGFATHDSSVLPIYIGDDKTDEDAFQALKKIGHGCSIIVSSAPRETLAQCSLCDPLEVQLFLSRLAKWGEESSK